MNHEAAKTMTWQQLHALAIEKHRTAFDGEHQQSPNVEVIWKDALFYWGELLHRNEFWQALNDKGKKLDAALFSDNTPINQLKYDIPRFLIEVHTDIILSRIGLGIKLVRHHFEVIRNSNLGQNPEESEEIRQYARQQIHSQFLRFDALVKNNDDEFAEIIKHAEIVHFLDPCRETAMFLLEIYLKWFQKYENEQLEIVRERYPEYNNIIKRMDRTSAEQSPQEPTNRGDTYDPNDVNAMDEFEFMEYKEDLYRDIHDDEEIQMIQEEQADLIDDLESVVYDAIEYYDKKSPKQRENISIVLYVLGRHYYASPENSDTDLAIDFLEEAKEIDPSNEFAIHLLDQIYENED